MRLVGGGEIRRIMRPVASSLFSNNGNEISSKTQNGMIHMRLS